MDSDVDSTFSLMIHDSTRIFDVMRLTKSLQSAGDMVPVIRNVSFSISKGEFVMLHGSPGSGKSILFYSLLGLEQPTSGNIFFEGVDIYTLSEQERALLRRQKLGVIYRNPLWIHALDVLQNIEFSIHLSDPIADNVHGRAMDILAMIGAERWMHHRPSDLDTSTQIVISIGRALASQASVIMGDDITKHLDAATGHIVMSALKRLNSQGITITIVTSNEQYLDYATRSILLDGGHISDNQMRVSAFL